MTGAVELRRCVEWVELRENLHLDYDLTEEVYRSDHSVSGEVRALVEPDWDVFRAREHPPWNPIQSLVRRVGAGDGQFGDGFPRTELVVAVTRVPPPTLRDSALRAGVGEVEFDVEGLPENGTVTLDADWSAERARESLTEDRREVVSHEYDVSGYPTGQLPIVVRGHLQRDAREYVENLPRETRERLVERAVDDSEEAFLERYEGWAVLSIRVEYREDAPEQVVALGEEELSIRNLRMEMESTFPDVEFHPRAGSTYNPERKRIEWRGQRTGPGGTLRYDVFGPMEDLLGMGRVSASVRGYVRGETLTGSEVVRLYDRTGRPIDDRPIPTGCGVVLTGDVELDPTALRTEDRKVMEASLTLEDTPFDAFDRLERVCNREGMTVRESEPPTNPEPVPNQEGVLEVTPGAKGDGEDEPGRLGVKREYGDEGVVYARMVVYGQFTPVSRSHEVAQSPGVTERSEDRVVRSDEGALERRGRTTVDVRARSRDAELNQRFVEAVREGVGG